MARIELPIDIGFYLSDSLPLSAQECINMYPVNPQTKGASTPGALFRTPGAVEVDDFANGVNRGFHKFNTTATLFCVAGTGLFIKTTLGANTSIGTITGTGRVSMASNKETVCIIVPGVTGYFWDAVSGLVEITDAVFLAMQLDNGGVGSVTLKDDRFIYTTEEFFYTGSVAATNKGQDFDALDFEDAETSSDPIIRAITIKNELYIMGTETIELYQNIGGDAFPFGRVLGASIEKGLKARFGVIAFDNSFVFLGGGKDESPAIWRGGSGSASKISTGAVDTVIQSYTDAELETVTSWTYTADGSFFAGWNFPNQTFVYDATASAIQSRPVWHERQSAGSVWNVEDIVTMFGQVIVAVADSSVIGTLSRAVLDEFGTAITRTFAGAFLENDQDSFTISSVELKTKAGFGNASAPGDDPMVLLESSLTGGITYNNLGERSLGVAGSYGIRQIWRRMGRVPQTVIFRFSTSAPISVDFYTMVLETDGSDPSQR